jgi:hypothetical protein
MSIPEEPLSISRDWEALRPDLRAALLVAVLIVLLEMVSDAIPLFGWLISLPFAVGVYLAQGVLAGVFLRRDSRYPRPSALTALGIGARSALWTGGLSLVVAVVTVIALIPVSLGAILAGLPAVLISFVVDLAINILFAALGAWIYTLTGGKGAAGISCLLSAILGACFWLALAVLVVTAILAALGILPHPSIHP